MEGVMMQSPSDESIAIAVRRPNGRIMVTCKHNEPLSKKHKWMGLPLIRGCVNMVETMKLSYSTLEDSAAMNGVDTSEPETRFEKWLVKKFGDGLMKAVMAIGMVLGVILSVALFVVLPNVATMGINALVSHLGDGAVLPSFLQNLISGVIRIIIFIAYLLLTSLMKDIRRTYEYHGAEHKTIFCYERGLELTVENARRMPRHHPRCGTSFLFVVIVVAVLASCVVFALPVVREVAANPIVRILLHLLLLPIVVAVTYEINRFIGRHDNPVTRALSAPGMWMQNFTTFEPDDSMLEVAIHALKLVLPREKGADAW